MGIDLTGANLTGADLTGADLTGANLTGADLTNADLTNADLTNADLTGANLAKTNFTNAGLTNAGLTNAGLTNANLTNANLTNANLTNANLTNANLTGANLTNADLTKTNLTGANLTKTNFTNANLTLGNFLNIHVATFARVLDRLSAIEKQHSDKYLVMVDALYQEYTKTTSTYNVALKLVQHIKDTNNHPKKCLEMAQKLFTACIGLNNNQNIIVSDTALKILGIVKQVNPGQFLKMSKKLFEAFIKVDAKQEIINVDTALEILDMAKWYNPDQWLGISQQLFKACIRVDAEQEIINLDAALEILRMVGCVNPDQCLEMAQKLFTACIGLNNNQRIRELQTALELIDMLKANPEKWLEMNQQLFTALINTHVEEDYKSALNIFNLVKESYPIENQKIIEMREQLEAFNPFVKTLKEILHKGGHLDYALKLDWRNLIESDFVTFIEKMKKIKDMQSDNQAIKNNVYKNLAEIIIAMDSNDNMREICKNYAAAGLGNCYDAVNDAFVNMQISVKLYKDITPLLLFEITQKSNINKIIKKWIAIECELQANNDEKIEIGLKMKQILFNKYIPEIALNDIIFNNCSNVDENTQSIKNAIIEIGKYIENRDAIYSDMLLSDGTKYRNTFVNKLYLRALNHLLGLIGDAVWLESGEEGMTIQEQSRIDFIKLMEEIYKSPLFTDDEKSNILNIVNKSYGIHDVTSGLDFLIGPCKDYAKKYNELNVDYEIRDKELLTTSEKLEKDMAYLQICTSNTTGKDWVIGYFSCYPEWSMTFPGMFNTHQEKIKSNITQSQNKLADLRQTSEQLKQEMMALEHKSPPGKLVMLERLHKLFTTEVKYVVAKNTCF